MISRLIELEQTRLKSLGFDSVVTPVAMPISKGLVNVNIGNDTYILTGIRMSNTDVAADRHTVSISSATDALEASQRDIATMGQAIHKLLKNFIIIKTVSEDEWSADNDVPVYTLDFMKVTPIKN